MRLLRVSLTDAGALLRCLEKRSDAGELKELSHLLFQHRWCYRPKEMAPDWKDMSQWCVWGFADPAMPKAC